MLRTVVADDVTPTRALLVDALRVSGRFEVVAQAGDGLAALAAIIRHQPDLALLDLGMPVAGGLDVLEELNRASPATRVVVVSGFPGRGLQELAAARGAAGYVRKQLSIKAVINDVIVAAGMLDIADAALATKRALGADASAPREARRFVAELLNKWSCADKLDVIQLALSELVTNAVIHAQSGPEIAVRLLDGCIRIEVSDNDPKLPERSAPSPLQSSGRGMHILDACATRWGVEPRSAGKIVWFEVPRLEQDGARGESDRDQC
ncbi:MAG: response regulator [Acidimicrobiales bacterium]